MIHHIKKNVGCIDFLKEMYDNNKTMLYNEGAVFDLIKEICENIEAEPEDSYYKAKLLDFYRYLIYCNGRSLKNHQIQILKIMQDDSYQNIMVKISKEQIEELVAEYERDNAESHEIVMNPQLTYLCNFFQIMASLIDNNNVVNIGKLLKRYPF
jgi:inositol 1,4,5-triphosphate receptor type 1/inositol 1,4,5-triphosphate receptor type 3